MDKRLEGRSEILLGDNLDIAPNMLRMLNNRVLVEYHAQEKITAGGIILPECSQKVVDMGTIVKVGEITDPSYRDVGIVVGAVIKFDGLNVIDLVLQNKNYAIVNVTDIKGVIENEEAQPGT